jgi:hypothetical protein
LNSKIFEVTGIIVAFNLQEFKLKIPQPALAEERQKTN